MRSDPSRQASMPHNRRFTPRQIITLVAIVMVGAVLIPTAVYAAATIVKIEDADSTTLAQVDAGKLRVGDGGGGLTVDGNVGISQSSNTVQPVAREPEQEAGSLTVPSGTGFRAFTIFTVPDGKRLVLETVSARATLPDGQRAGVVFEVDNGDSSEISDFVLPLAFELDNGPQHLYGATQEVRGYGIPGGEVELIVTRSASTGSVSINWSISGHLVPA